MRGMLRQHDKLVDVVDWSFLPNEENARIRELTDSEIEQDDCGQSRCFLRV
jgi:hypothetical protein